MAQAWTKTLVGAICLSAGVWAQGTRFLQVHRLELADCDDVAFGPMGDLYFACHSPFDRLSGNVRGVKPSHDEMDAYVIRLHPQTGRVIFATRLGGKSYDGAWRIAVDPQGNAYATGLTKSPDFPTTADALQRDLRGKSDAFLVKVGPDGDVLYSTLLGGDADELGNGLAIDTKGIVYLGGVTSSSDFKGRRLPKTSTDDDAFVCRLPLPGLEILCVVFGGDKPEKLAGVALDSRGGLYAVGSTGSMNFPAVHPIQKSLRGRSDLFLTRLALPSMKTMFSTTFGGSGDDTGWGVAVDRQGNPVVTGTTESADLPGTSESYQPTNRGKKDAFVTTLHLRHNRRIRTTYLGGTSDDEIGYDGRNVTVDGEGNIWIVGTTYSEDLSVRNGSQLRYGGGNGDGFVAAFDPQLRRLCFATYFGDKGRNLLEGIAMAPTGVVAATGVSFDDAPGRALSWQTGDKTLYVRHHAVLLQGSRMCAY